MSSQTKPMMSTGMGLATAAAMVAATVAIPVAHKLADVQIPAFSSAFTLVDSEHHWSNGNAGNWSDSDSDDSSSSSSSYDDDNDGEHHDDDHHGGFGNIFGFVGNFLTNNQAAVEAFAAGVPTFYLGPVAVGQGVLANAFYNGYNGSATGLSGVWAYVSSQIGNVTEFIKNAVLTVTSMIPSIPLGPVWVGGSRLANAFFDGYNGSATGLAGIISYVTASLGLQAPAPAGAAKSAAATSAAASLPRVSAATVTLATPATAAAAAAKRNVARAAAAGTPRSAAKAAGAKSAPKAAAASRRAR
ncbi:hypothetical protein [Mycolicibacterium sp.]|uniref:hypothetical protein n=1 Tax=Mycolicibacterium sp. TaxID=2320850 RepID=UPI0025FEAF97|nr:hypothetical protein [Mycolicibacterium sp.]